MRLVFLRCLAGVSGSTCLLILRRHCCWSWAMAPSSCARLQHSRERIDHNCTDASTAAAVLLMANVTCVRYSQVILASAASSRPRRQQRVASAHAEQPQISLITTRAYIAGHGVQRGNEQQARQRNRRTADRQQFCGDQGRRLQALRRAPPAHFVLPGARTARPFCMLRTTCKHWDAAYHIAGEVDCS